MAEVSPQRSGLELPQDYSVCLGRCGHRFRSQRRVPFCDACLALLPADCLPRLAELDRLAKNRETWAQNVRLHAIRKCLRALRLIPAIWGLTCRNPWAWAIAHAGKRIENRVNPLPCEVGDFIAIHAGAQLDPAGEEWIRAHLGISCYSNPRYRSIVAVGRYGGAVQNSSDPWAMPGYVHNLLEDVIAIEDVPCSGQQGLWTIPDLVLETVLHNYNRARRQQAGPFREAMQ